MSEPEPISPELALVAPELAAAARAALPDRPWEAFAPPRTRAELRLAALVPAAVPPPPPPRKRRVVTGGRIAVAAAIALVAASFLPPRDAPHLVADSALPARAGTVRIEPRRARSTDPGCAPEGTRRSPFQPICPGRGQADR